MSASRNLLARSVPKWWDVQDAALKKGMVLGIETARIEIQPGRFELGKRPSAHQEDLRIILFLSFLGDHCVA